MRFCSFRFLNKDRSALSGALALLIFCTITLPDGTSAGEAPVRNLPVPKTVSPEMGRLIGLPGPGSLATIPATDKDWKVFRAGTQAPAEKLVDTLIEKYQVSIRPKIIGGVNCFVVTPKSLRPGGDHKILLGLHGGGFVGGQGRAGLLEAVEMAGLTGYKVIAVDYRMPPDFPFPAGLEDSLAVWRGLLTNHSSGQIGVFGSSAGGGLTLSFVQRLIQEKQPLPAAIMAGSPWSDLTKTGDSYYVNEDVDNLLGRYDGFLEACAKVYAHGRNLKDPGLSPIYGNFKGFPPTMLVSGTRDLFLSNTIRVEHKLLEVKAPVQLEIQEGESHTQYLFGALGDAPESLGLYADIGNFFDHYIGRKHKGHHHNSTF
jgi:acetyl esterase/lipase